MGHIIALLRQALLAVHDLRMKMEVYEVKYSILENALSLVLKLALAIDDEESEGR